MSDPMSHSQTASACDGVTSQVQTSLAASGTTARIDPPHLVGQSKTPQSKLPPDTEDKDHPQLVGQDEAPAIEDVAAEETHSGRPLSPERIRRHARQLATVLRRRQEQLDHREAQLNARAAQIENDLRVLRLLWNERHAEWEEKRQLLAEREAAIAQRRAELGERAESLSQREQFLAQWEESLRTREADLARQEQSLDEKRKELSRRESAVQVRESDLAAYAVLIDHETEVQQSTAATGDSSLHSNDLVRKKNELEYYLQEAKRILSELQDARQRWKEEERQWRQRWTMEQRQAMAELASQREAVARRSQALDRLESELSQLKEEVEAKYREAIEHHLAACELAATLEKDGTPAVIAKQLIALRQKLDQSVKASLEEQRRRDQRIAMALAQLQSLHQQVTEEKKRADESIALRLSELEKVASQLAEREKQLVVKEQEINERVPAWQLTELGYILEIQRLRECLESESNPNMRKDQSL